MVKRHLAATRAVVDTVAERCAASPEQQRSSRSPARGMALDRSASVLQVRCSCDFDAKEPRQAIRFADLIPDMPVELDSNEHTGGGGWNNGSGAYEGWISWQARPRFVEISAGRKFRGGAARVVVFLVPRRAVPALS